ncbi:transmembrane protein 56-like [Chenopodium quinoa]|uniref:TLC domain-containing protein n=1 Tax=Chenopodium quinoa TaxID=63459 RepID=A0A803KWX1_CHEQI|nr:transmembrane protein 56-like [Chenopodium quinoa]
MTITDYQNWVTQLSKEYQFEYPWVPFTSVLCGIFACKLVYDLSHLINGICFKHYSTLPKIKQIEWDNRAISTLHAIFVTAVSIYLAFWSDLYSDDLQRGSILFRSSTLSTFVLGVSVGYFLSDIAMIFWFYPALGGMEYVLHHVLSTGALAYAMLNSTGQFYTYMVLLSEITTPGINMRWYLDAAGMKKSKAYVVNGVGIFLTWLVARVLLFMYVYFHIYSHYDQIKQLPRFAYLLTLGVPCVIGGLNLMWFAKITKGMIKTLTAKKD